jgi:hypothetical protein
VTESSATTCIQFHRHTCSAITNGFSCLFTRKSSSRYLIGVVQKVALRGKTRATICIQFHRHTRRAIANGFSCLFAKKFVTLSDRRGTKSCCKMRQFSCEGQVYSKILGYVCEGAIPEAWNQPFIFKERTNCLRQLQGGPCGVLAAVQAHILVLLRRCPQLRNDQLLEESLLTIMSLIRPCFVFCTALDAKSHKLTWCGTQDRGIARQWLEQTKWTAEPMAVILFTVSIVVLVGPSWLQHFAIPDTFITENGQTNLTCVLLLLTGQIMDSYHDGNLIVGGMVIKGAVGPVPIGLLSVSVYQNLQKSGDVLRRPTERIWIAYWGGHFTTIIAMPKGLYEMDQLMPSAAFLPLDSSHTFWDQLQSAIR